MINKDAEYQVNISYLKIKKGSGWDKDKIDLKEMYENGVTFAISEHIYKLNKKKATKRRNTYRKVNGFRQKIDFIPTNLEGTEGFDKHHFNESLTISLPSFIHNEIKHNLFSSFPMLKVNSLVLTWLLGTW